MHGLDVHRGTAEIERLDQRQHLTDGDGAGRGRRRAADIETAIEHADRLAQFGAIVCEVFGGELAWPARIVLHGGGDVSGDGALIEGGRSLSRDRFKG